MVGLRRAFAALAGLLAAVLLPLGMTSSWVAGLLTDTDQYVDTVGPLADHDAIQRATIALLDRQALALIDLHTRTPALVTYLRSHGFTRLADSGGALTDAVREQIGKTVKDVVTAAVEGPAFPPVWRTANRTAHAQLVRILRDDAVVDEHGHLVIDLSSELTTVAGLLQRQGLVPAGALPKVQTTFTLARSSDLSKARRAYSVLDGLGFWLPVLWVVAFAASVLLARRRIRALRLILFGSVIGILALIVGIDVLGHRLAHRSPDSAVTTAVWDRITASLRLGLLVGSLLAAAGFTWLSTLVPNRLGQPPSRTAVLTARLSAAALVVLAAVTVILR